MSITWYGLCSKDQKNNFPLSTDVSNLAIRASWKYVQLSQGTFSWKNIDAALNALPPGGKASISIHAGNDTPTWVLALCQNFVLPNQLAYPAPWDSKFLASLNTLIQAVGARYGADERVDHFCIPALCSFTAESSLDNIYKPANNVQALKYWSSVGYSPYNAISAVQLNVNAMLEYLGNKRCAITYTPANGGLSFDTVTGKSTVQNIHTWYLQQNNVLIYNCGMGPSWCLPAIPNSPLPAVYQEVFAQGSQQLFNQTIALAMTQGVSAFEIYQSDLPFVSGFPKEPVALYVDEDGFYRPADEETEE